MILMMIKHKHVTAYLDFVFLEFLNLRLRIKHNPQLKFKFILKKLLGWSPIEHGFGIDISKKYNQSCYMIMHIFRVEIKVSIF